MCMCQPAILIFIMMLSHRGNTSSNGPDIAPTVDERWFTPPTKRGGVLFVTAATKPQRF